jgi:hypothetical protein
MGVNSNSLVAHKIIGYYCTFVAQLVSDFLTLAKIDFLFCFCFDFNI